MSNDDIERRLTVLEKDVKAILAWVNQQKGGKKAFYALMATSAAFGGLITKAVDFLLAR